MNGEQIRAAREARGWTQAELATHIGVGQRTVGNWERGDTIPKNKLGRLAQVLKDDPVTVDEPLSQVSEVALLAELMRRAAARERSA